MTKTELAIIGTILVHSDECLWIAYKYGVTSQSFTTHVAQYIWEAIDYLHQRGKHVSIASVEKQFLLKYENLQCSSLLEQAIDNAVPPSNVTDYVLELKKEERRRIVKDCLVKGSQVIDRQDPDEIANRISAALIKTVQHQDIKLYNPCDLMEEKMAQWRNAKGRGYVGVPFCLKSINEALGGFRQGCMCIIGAYRGVGKSTLVRHDCYNNAINDRRSILFSLEDPADITLAKMAACRAGMGTFFLDTGRAYDASYDKISEAWSEMKDLPFRVVSQSLTIEQICSITETEHLRNPLDIIYIDHIQFIQPQQLPNMNRTQTLAHYSLSLVGLAKKLNIPVVVLSQLSRDCEKQNREPRISDLRDSGSLEQDARQILLLYWDANIGHHILEVAKNSYGVTGVKYNVWRLDGKERFSDTPPVTDEEAEYSQNPLDMQ